MILLAFSPSDGVQGYPGGSGGGYPGGGGVAHGTYVWTDSTGHSPTYSGGQCVTDHGSGPEAPVPYGPRDASGWGGQVNGWGGQTNGYPVRAVGANCSGAITATFTWKSDPSNPNEPPPASVIVQQDCMVQCYLSGGTGSTGSYATGLGQSGSGSGPYDIVYTRNGKQYTAQNTPGPSFSLSPPCSPSVSASTALTGACSGLVEYSATAIVPLLQAHSTVDTANWDAAHPRFFSGTNCSVSGTATAYSAPPGGGSYPAGGTYVKQATLNIGGTLIKEYDDTNSPPPSPAPNVIYLSGTNQGSVPLSAFFDSTHFADGPPISIQMTVTDSGGLTYPVLLSGPACNNLVAVANQTSSAIDPATGENVAINAANGSAKGQKGDAYFQPYPGVMTQSSPNNIGAVGIFDHHKSVLINDIATSGYTVFFATTHAGQGALGDCYSVSDKDAQGNPNPAYDPGAYLHDADIQGAIKARTTALSAPYLFAYLYGCNGASDPTTIAADFGFSQTSSDDRAFLGYAAAVAVTQQNTNFAVQTWYYLMQGQTLDAATTEAASDYHIQPWPNLNSYTTTAIWGDSHLTLHGKVYNWVSGPTWYR